MFHFLRSCRLRAAGGRGGKNAGDQLVVGRDDLDLPPQTRRLS